MGYSSKEKNLMVPKKQTGLILLLSKKVKQKEENMY